LQRKKPMLVLQALWELIRYDLVNVTFGFQRICRQVASQRVASQKFSRQTESLVCDAVSLAACFYYKPVRCLQGSVAAARLLQKSGIKSCLVIGYRPAPFLSHAWVEVDGRVVNDSPVYKERLHVLCTF
jgi:Transglutaminase-like superfamily